MIRPFRQEDTEAVCALFNKDEFFLIYPSGKFPMDAQQLEDLRSKRFEFTVAEQDQQICGFANLYDLEKNQYAFIGNVVIAPQLRGKGLGRAMALAMMQAAFNKHRLAEVRLSVFCNNLPAIRLYHSLGFQPYGLEPRQTPEGKPAMLLHMKKSRDI